VTKGWGRQVPKQININYSASTSTSLTAKPQNCTLHDTIIMAWLMFIYSRW